MNYSTSIPTKDAKKAKTTFALLLFAVSLFLASMDFFNKYFYFLYFCFAVLFILGVKSFHINFFVFALLGISFSYLIFNPNSAYSITGVLKQFVYPLSYLCGLNCLRLFDSGETSHERTKSREKGFLFICYTIAAGILVHVLLNLYNNQGLEGRLIDDFWGGAASATCNAALFCFGIGMIPALLLNKSGWFGKTFSIVCLISFTLFALILAGRTFFFLFLIVFILSVFFSAYKARDIKKAFGLILIVSVIVGVLFAIYKSNFLNVKNLFESSNFYDRFYGKWASDITEDGRMERKQMYFQNMLELKNLFGGGKLRAASKTKYAHELYLDLLSDAGIFAYVICIVFVFSRTFRAFKFAASNQTGYSRLFGVVVFGIFLSLNIEFFIEPILQGVPWLFPTFCILCGMIDYIILKKQTDVQIKKGEPSA